MDHHGPARLLSGLARTGWLTFSPRTAAPPASSWGQLLHQVGAAAACCHSRHSPGVAPTVDRAGHPSSHHALTWLRHIARPRTVRPLMLPRHPVAQLGRHRQADAHHHSRTSEPLQLTRVLVLRGCLAGTCMQRQGAMHNTKRVHEDYRDAVIRSLSLTLWWTPRISVFAACSLPCDGIKVVMITAPVAISRTMAASPAPGQLQLPRTPGSSRQAPPRPHPPPPATPQGLPRFSPRIPGHTSTTLLPRKASNSCHRFLHDRVHARQHQLAARHRLATMPPRDALAPPPHQCHHLSLSAVPPPPSPPPTPPSSSTGHPLRQPRPSHCFLSLSESISSAVHRRGQLAAVAWPIHCARAGAHRRHTTSRQQVPMQCGDRLRRVLGPATTQEPGPTHPSVPGIAMEEHGLALLWRWRRRH